MVKLAVLTGFFLLASALFSCGNRTDSPGDAHAQPVSSCRDLDTIFAAIDTLMLNLPEKGSDFSRLDAQCRRVIAVLRRNFSRQGDSCMYFDHTLHPDKDRFGFIELLKDRIIGDTLSEGMFYLLELRGIFSADEDISEFFSEEFARIAEKNPHAYLAYIRDNPGQREMVLRSTRWDNVRVDSVIADFAAHPHGKDAAKFLTNWQANHIIE